MHEASSLESEEEVKAWREGKAQGEIKAEGGRIKDEGKPQNRLFPLQSLSDDELPRDTIEEVITRRGSTRQFSRESITFVELSIMIDRATRGIDSDFLGPEEPPLNELYLIVHAVEGLPLRRLCVSPPATRTRVIKGRATFAVTPAISVWARRSRPIAASIFIS